MNPEILKKMAWYMLGALAGAGVGYGVTTFILENVLETEEEELVFEEDDEVIEDEIETVQPKKQSKKEKVNYNNMFKGDKNPDLEVLAAKYKDGMLAVEEEDFTGDEDEILEQEEEVLDRTKPYLIDREAFETEFMKAHKKVHLNYYDEEEILEDAETKALLTAAPEKFLGPIALTSFGEDEIDPDFVHVRNEVLESDYSINIIYTPYEKKPVKKVVKRKPEVNEQ